MQHYYQRAKVPGSTVALLTYTTKMPGPSFSLPAHQACPRENGSICASCYAGKGCYLYRSTQHAQNVRFNWTILCMNADPRVWVEVMIEAIKETGCQYFRVHDSGDMFNARYAESWYQVCLQLPEVKFWIPTRAWQQASGPLPLFDAVLNTLQRMARLPNVTVRPSALNFGDTAPEVSGLHAGSTADCVDVFKARQCPAPQQNGQCGECRACWDHKDCPVSYTKH